MPQESNDPACWPRKPGWWQAPPTAPPPPAHPRQARRKKARWLISNIADHRPPRTPSRDRCGQPRPRRGGHTAAGSDCRSQPPRPLHRQPCAGTRGSAATGSSGQHRSSAAHRLDRCRHRRWPATTPAAAPAHRQRCRLQRRRRDAAACGNSQLPCSSRHPSLRLQHKKVCGSSGQLKQSANLIDVLPTVGKAAGNVHLKRRRIHLQVRLLIYIGAWRRCGPVQLGAGRGGPADTALDCAARAGADLLLRFCFSPVSDPRAHGARRHPARGQISGRRSPNRSDRAYACGSLPPCCGWPAARTCSWRCAG